MKRMYAEHDFIQYVSNPGTFLAALQIITTDNEVLRCHLVDIGLVNKNAVYTSARIQNKIIDIIGHDIIRSDLIQEIKAAGFFSVLTD